MFSITERNRPIISNEYLHLKLTFRPVSRRVASGVEVEKTSLIHYFSKFSEGEKYTVQHFLFAGKDDILNRLLFFLSYLIVYF